MDATIRISQELRDKLKDLREVSRESYNDVIERLIEISEHKEEAAKETTMKKFT